MPFDRIIVCGYGELNRGSIDLDDRTKWAVTPEDQQKYILALSENLTALRAKAGISQAELAGIIGVSRQTYAPIETGKRKMSWTVYLALILFYDYFHATHQMIRDLRVFPGDFVERFNNDCPFAAANDGLFSDVAKANEMAQMVQRLDAQGIRKVNAVLGAEFNRCGGKLRAASRPSRKAVVD